MALQTLGSGPKPGRYMIGDDMFTYSKYGIITDSTTALSSDFYDYKGHDIQGGIQIKSLEFCRRNWQSSGPGLPGKTQDFDLVLPSEFLLSHYKASVGNSATPVTKIGQDLHFWPSDWGKKARSARRFVPGQPGANAFAKVNWSDHTFLFTNYSRHPVQMFAEILIGANRRVWMRPDHDLNSSTDVYSAQTVGTNWPDQFPNVETFVLPPTLDRNDMGAKVKWSPGRLNWNRIFGPDYSSATPAEDFAYPALGPWLEINNDHLEGNNSPQPVIATDPGASLDAQAMEPYHARLRFWAVIMEPHGGLFKTDLGTTAANGRATLDSDSINVEVYSKWDTTLAFVGGVRHELGFDRARETAAFA